MIRTFQGMAPVVAGSAYVDPAAQVIGQVTLGERVSIWPNATLRGDVNKIFIGTDSNIQDNAVVHVEHAKFECHVGERVTVGHAVVLHGCVVEDDSLIGIGAIVLNGARIGAGSVVAAGALVPEGMQVPPGSMVMGVPAKVKREVSAEEQQRFRVNAQHYVDLGQTYKNDQSS